MGRIDQGLAAMFHMMNEARITVGAQAAALGYSGYLKSVDYARTRQQGRSSGNTHAADTQVPIIEHADVKRMLLQQKCYAEGGLAVVLYCGRLMDEKLTASTPAEARDAELLLDLLTPVAKTWPSHWCLYANELDIQVHGGYGYSRDYDVEQLYRDNRLNAIHEGTTGIQALDLLGRKTAPARQRALDLLDARVRTSIAQAQAATAEAARFGGALCHAWERTRDVTQLIHASADPDRFANATLYLHTFGHVVMSWIWLEQFMACDRRGGAFAEGKKQATRYFFRYELPRTDADLNLLARVDRTCAEVDPQWL